MGWRDGLIGLSLILAAVQAVAQPDRSGEAAAFDAAFRDAQMAIGSRTALALSRGAARLAAASPDISALIRQRQTVNDALDQGERAEADARSTARTDRTALAAIVRRTAQLRVLLAAIDAGLAARAPAYVQLTSIAPVAAADAVTLLARDEALVMIYPARAATYVFAIGPGGRGWQRVAITERALAETVRRLRGGLAPDARTRGGEDAAPVRQRIRPAFDRALAYALYRQLWAPIARVVGDAATVYVVPGGATGGLPLSVLVRERPRGDDRDPAALRRTDWLVRRHALVTLPSIGSLRALRAAQVVRAGRPFAGFGAPDLAGAAGPLARLAALPGTADELDRLAALLGGIITTGAAATEAAVRAARLNDTRVVAFATHGLLANELGEGAEPALVLTPGRTGTPADDGLLTAAEASTLDLSADWVVLSACNTAAGDGQADGEGLSGLARGFFSAGARAVLVSHWRVRDDVAVALTAGTLAAHARDPGAGRAAALRRAMLAMIDDPAHPERAEPALWAPFVVAGEGR